MEPLDFLINALDFHPRYVPLKTAADMLDGWRVDLVELDFCLEKINELAGFTVRQAAEKLPALMAALDEQVNRVAVLALQEAEEIQRERHRAAVRAEKQLWKTEEVER